ncbi:MAG TPA: trigger factor family protein, partial [Thermomicrobiales bacterium]|nr:trigger factor family protein [Thermomicrobiales bacterium]
MTVDRIPGSTVELDIYADDVEFSEAYEKALRRVSRDVTIPGFRKGHVPAPIIDQRMGREAVVEQAVNSSLDEFYQVALAETDTRPMGRPTADVEQWLDVKDPASEIVLAFE